MACFFLLSLIGGGRAARLGWTVTNVDVAVEPVTGGSCEVRCSKCNVSVDGVTPFDSLWHMPHHTIPYHTLPYHTMPYHTIPYHTMQDQTRPDQTRPDHAIPYHTMPGMCHVIACHVPHVLLQGAGTPDHNCASWHLSSLVREMSAGFVLVTLKLASNVVHLATSFSKPAMRASRDLMSPMCTVVALSLRVAADPIRIRAPV